MLRAIRRADAAMRSAVARGAPVERATAAPSLAELARMRDWPAAHVDASAEILIERIERELGEIV
jgi:hypothetical protein